MKYIFTFLILLTCSYCYSQDYEIQDMTEKHFQESGALGSKEIQVINRTAKKVILECSLNKHDWKRKEVKAGSGIDVYLTSDVAYFYVRVCYGSARVTCDMYRLAPSIRYVLPLPVEEEKIIIKKLAE